MISKKARVVFLELAAQGVVFGISRHRDGSCELAVDFSKVEPRVRPEVEERTRRWRAEILNFFTRQFTPDTATLFGEATRWWPRGRLEDVGGRPA